MSLELYKKTSLKANKMASLIGYLEGSLMSIKCTTKDGDTEKECEKVLKELDKRWKALQSNCEDKT